MVQRLTGADISGMSGMAGYGVLPSDSDFVRLAIGERCSCLLGGDAGACVDA